MKKLRITIEDRVYDVTVEVLEDDDAPASPQPLLPSPTPVQQPAAAPAVVPPAVALAAAAPPPPAAGPGSIVSPLSGTIIRIDVQAGQQVNAGDNLVCLEAMKMNTEIVAPAAGYGSVNKRRNRRSVQEGHVLLMIS